MDKNRENRERGRRNQRMGKSGEEKAARALGRLGLLMIEEIGTPFKIVATKEQGNFKWHRIKWGKKVSADHTALMPNSGGRRVLIEVKSTQKRENLIWSKLEDHQPQRLTMNVEHGAVSLLVWVRLDVGVVNIMQWPVPGFRKGRGGGITPERADELNIESLDELR